MSNSVVGHDYILIRDLGEGTFGTVKLARHVKTKNLVAIKILEKSRIKESADLERVKREIEILKEIKHENIVELFEIVEN